MAVRVSAIIVIEVDSGVLDERPECAHKKTADQGGSEDGGGQGGAGHVANQCALLVGVA